MTKGCDSSLRRHDGERARKGVPLLPVNEPEVVVTLETVNALRDELAVTDAPPHSFVTLIGMQLASCPDCRTWVKALLSHLADDVSAEAERSARIRITVI